MIDFIFGLGAGYLLKALLTSGIQHDILLCWDPNTLGWRTVAPGSKLSSGKRYLAAVEVKLKEEEA